ncbi:unnamed protein product [Leuciscus chuanchicus]
MELNMEQLTKHQGLGEKSCELRPYYRYSHYSGLFIAMATARLPRPVPPHVPKEKGACTERSDWPTGLLLLSSVCVSLWGHTLLTPHKSRGRGEEGSCVFVCPRAAHVACLPLTDDRHPRGDPPCRNTFLQLRRLCKSPRQGRRVTGRGSKGREGKGREGKRREEKRREEKRREEKRREEKRREEKRREEKRREEKMDETRKGETRRNNERREEKRREEKRRCKKMG